MFDLEHAIADWRRRMLAAGIKTPALLDELESHLREDVERRVQMGSGATEAFHAAVERIGEAGVLQAEYAKIGEIMSARERKVTWILCAVCVVADFLIGIALLLNLLPHESLALRDRMLAAGAWLFFPALLWGWRYTYRFLPVIYDKRKRLLVAGVSCALGVLCSGILLALIPAGASDPGLFISGFAWALLPAFLGATLIVGLEEAAYQKLAP